MYNKYMNNDQQNTNQQPPVPQATLTAQPLPSQPPVIANQQPAVSNQPLPPPTSPAQIPPNPAPVNTNQPNSAVQPPAFLPPNSEALGYSGQDNSAENPVPLHQGYPGLTFHSGRTAAMSGIGLIVAIIIAVITNLDRKPYGAVGIGHILIVLVLYFSVSSDVRSTRMKWIRDISGIMCVTNIILLIMHTTIGFIGTSSPGDIGPLYEVTHPSLFGLPFADMLIIIGIYMLFIIPLGIAYFVARVMYKKEIGQNR